MGSVPVSKFTTLYMSMFTEIVGTWEQNPGNPLSMRVSAVPPQWERWKWRGNMGTARATFGPAALANPLTIAPRCAHGRAAGPHAARSDPRPMGGLTGGAFRPSGALLRGGAGQGWGSVS